MTESQIRNFAGPIIYTRGLAYFKDGMVQNLDYDQETDSIQVEVEGSHGAVYEVEIHFGAGEMDVSCDCPYDGYPCKHIVATLLAFLHEREKHLQAGQKAKKADASLKSKISKLSKDELVAMVMACSQKYPDFKQGLMVRFQPDETATLATILKQIEKAFPAINSRSYVLSRIAKDLNTILKSANDAPEGIKIEVNWEVADRILNELNEYGMDDEPLENTLVDALDTLVECFTEGKSHAEKKAEIMGGLMDFYTWGNSSMVDYIYETVMNLCTEKSDYQIVIDKLEAQSSSRSYHQHLLADLYETIGDEAAQLRNRCTETPLDVLV